jgi:hypothetical protein
MYGHFECRNSHMARPLGTLEELSSCQISRDLSLLKLSYEPASFSTRSSGLDLLFKAWSLGRVVRADVNDLGRIPFPFLKDARLMKPVPFLSILSSFLEVSLADTKDFVRLLDRPERHRSFHMGSVKLDYSYGLSRYTFFSRSTPKYLSSRLALKYSSFLHLIRLLRFTSLHLHLHSAITTLVYLPQRFSTGTILAQTMMDRLHQILVALVGTLLFFQPVLAISHTNHASSPLAKRVLVERPNVTTVKMPYRTRRDPTPQPRSLTWDVSICRCHQLQPRNGTLIILKLSTPHNPRRRLHPSPERYLYKHLCGTSSCSTAVEEDVGDFDAFVETWTSTRAKCT